MLTLYSYPELFGVADNNPYGLKTFAFLKLTKVPFRHEHIFDASAAPRRQLPYIEDDGEATYETLARKGETMTTATMVTYAYDQIDQARTELEHPS